MFATSPAIQRLAIDRGGLLPIKSCT